MKGLALIISLLSFSCFGQFETTHGWNSLSETTYPSPEEYYTVKRDSAKTKKPHSVKKAVLLSIIPGGGQIYNHLAMPKGKKKAYWKVPLIYAGLGATGYFLYSNQSNVNSLKLEYNYMEENNGAHSDGSEWDNWKDYDQSGILELHSQYSTWRDLSILGVVFVYALQLVDAGVEAHFVNFDVSKDLSLRIDPVMYDRQNAGLKVSLNFR